MSRRGNRAGFQVGCFGVARALAMTIRAKRIDARYITNAANITGSLSLRAFSGVADSA